MSATVYASCGDGVVIVICSVRVAMLKSLAVILTAYGANLTMFAGCCAIAANVFSTYDVSVNTVVVESFCECLHALARGGVFLGNDIAIIVHAEREVELVVIINRDILMEILGRDRCADGNTGVVCHICGSNFAVNRNISCKIKGSSIVVKGKSEHQIGRCAKTNVCALNRNNGA